MKVRIPFIPLSYTQEYKSIPGELMVDYENDLLYIKKSDNMSVSLPNKDFIKAELDSIKDEMIGVSNIDYDTMRKVELRLLEVMEWFDYHDGPNSSSILSIMDSYRNYDFSTSLLDKLTLKVDKVTDKRLSTNNFTSEDVNKIQALPHNANSYIHPKERVCNYVPDVTMVNGKTGCNVIITKFDIEDLGDVHPYANNYIHPDDQVCSYEFPVKSLDAKTGDVTVTKDCVGLGLVENLPIVDDLEQLYNPDINDERYVTAYKLRRFIHDLIYGNADIEDGRFELEVIKKPLYNNSVFKLRREANNEFETVPWTYGHRFRLYPGKYQYVVENNIDWRGLSGEIEIIDKDEVLELEVQRTPRYYAKIININGPRIREVYYSEFPFTSELKGLIFNGAGMLRVDPTIRYRYRLVFGSDFPDTTDTFMMPWDDILIIHDGGGTSNDLGGKIGTMDDIPDPPKKGKVAFNTDPSDAVVELRGFGETVEGEKLYEIEYDVTYKYIVRREGYFDFEGQFILYPWEGSINIDIELEKISPIEFRVKPILLELLKIEIYLDDNWRIMPLDRTYFNYTVFDTGQAIGHPNNEYAIYSISEVPSGQYEYRVIYNGIEVESDHINHDSEDPNITDIILPSNTEKKATLFLDGNIPADETSKVKINFTSDENEWFFMHQGMYVLTGFTDSFKIKYDGNEDLLPYEGTFNLTGPVTYAGGYTTVSFRAESRSHHSGDPVIEEDQPNISDLPNKQEPIYEDVLFRITPNTPQVYFTIGDDIVVEDTFKNGIYYKSFKVERGKLYDYEIIFDGYKNKTGSFAKNVNIVEGEVDEMIFLEELGVFSVCINPITSEDISVQVNYDGLWEDLPKTSEMIPDMRFNMINGKASTEYQYSVFSRNDLESGDIEYRVVKDGSILKSDTVYYSSIEGCHNYIELGSISDRFYDIRFKIYDEMHDDITNSSDIYVTDGYSWTEIINGNHISSGNESEVKYKVILNDHEIGYGIEIFKGCAIDYGGIVEIPVYLNMLLGEPPKDPPLSSNPTLLPETQRYLWLETLPHECDIKIPSVTFTNNNTKFDIFRIQFMGIVRKLGITCREYKVILVSEGHANTPILANVSKDGFATEDVEIYWNDMIDVNKIHRIIHLRKAGRFTIGINPTTIDELDLVVHPTSDPKNTIYFRQALNPIQIGSFIDISNLNGVRDDQARIYEKETGGINGIYGSYIYKLTQENKEISSGIILHRDKINNIVYVGEDETRYHELHFLVVDIKGNPVNDADLYVYEDGVWVNLKNKRNYKVPQDVTYVDYAIFRNWYITVQGTTIFEGVGSKYGKLTRNVITLVNGVSELPKDPEGSRPTNPSSVSSDFTVLWVNVSINGISDDVSYDIINENNNISFELSSYNSERRVVRWNNGMICFEYIVRKTDINSLRYNLNNIRNIYNMGSTNPKGILTTRGNILNDTYSDENNIRHLSLESIEILIVPRTIDGVGVVVVDDDTDEEFECHFVKYVTTSSKETHIDTKTSQAQQFITPLLFSNHNYTIKVYKKEDGSVLKYDKLDKSYTQVVHVGPNIDRYYDIQFNISNVSEYDMGEEKYSMLIDGSYQSNNTGRFKIYGNDSSITYRIEKEGYIPIQNTMDLGVSAIHGGRYIPIHVNMDKAQTTHYVDLILYANAKSLENGYEMIHKVYIEGQIHINEEWVNIYKGHPIRLYNEGAHSLRYIKFKDGWESDVDMVPLNIENFDTIFDETEYNLDSVVFNKISVTSPDFVIVPSDYARHSSATIRMIAPKDTISLEVLKETKFMLKMLSNSLVSNIVYNIEDDVYINESYPGMEEYIIHFESIPSGTLLLDSENFYSKLHDSIVKISYPDINISIESGVKIDRTINMITIKI